MAMPPAAPPRDRSQTRTRTTSRHRIPTRSQTSSRRTWTPIRPSRTAASSELRLLRQHTPPLGENMRACYPAQRQLSVLPDIDAGITAQRDI